MSRIISEIFHALKLFVCIIVLGSFTSSVLAISFDVLNFTTVSNTIKFLTFTRDIVFAVF